jgi:hypothetical protein
MTKWKPVRYLAFALSALLLPVANASEELIMGWLEEIAIKPWNIVAKAKLDTGADTASLHGKDISRFERNGSEWIRFILELENEQGELRQYEVERPVTRNVKIKRHGARHQIRPVINMEFCMGSEIYKIEFSVTDRTKFSYPVLLGRNFLDGRGLVDSSNTYQTRLRCEAPLNAPHQGEMSTMPEGEAPPSKSTADI